MTRFEAERRIREVLDDAKAGQPQQIIDVDGYFEVRFTSNDIRESAGNFLAKGGPDDG
ncbi:hypothetical protein RsS62_10000 [Rhizobium dioscoreae]|nr:hypothetical protein RsS62_10000 [Rhizobium dioscoreae]